MPLSWWPIALVGAGVGAAELFAGFNWQVALLVYLVVVTPVLVLLLGMNSTVLRVDATALHAGRSVLPLADVADAVALDPTQTRLRLGPGADPAAVVVGRGFVRTAVLIRLRAPESAPYWLVTTRHPEALVAALTRSADPVSR